MLTLHAAASLLAQADTLTALRAIVRLLGFHSVRRLTIDSRRDLGIESLVSDAHLAHGAGGLRCLSAALVPHLGSAATTDTRELTRRLCVAAAQRAPGRSWCVVTLDAAAQTITIAAVFPDSRGPRIAALCVDRRRVVDSDADTLRSLAAITEPDPTLRHARFGDILGRDALSTRFYRALDHTVGQLAETSSGPASPGERRELALLCASRCLFLAFLEAKAWLNHDRQFLLHRVTACLERGGRLHERLLRPLFFGTLNTPVAQRAAAARDFGAVPFLNGGLFSPTPLERRRRALRFHDDTLASLLGDLLDRYRFTAQEDSTRWSEAAIDPEMLGRAFESLMAVEERHQSGTYYTPPELVDTVVRDALHAVLPDVPADQLVHDSAPLHLTARARTALESLRVLDPACGSGAFLVRALECLATLEARAGDDRPTHVVRRAVLTRKIFGVDRNPLAVWLCELRLWLSIVIECPETRISHIPTLPNLDHHIRVGDTLAGGDFRYAPPSAKRLTTLRDRYTRASGSRKRTLADALDREERHRAVTEQQRMIDGARYERRALLDRLRARDLFGDRPSRTPLDRQRLDHLRQRTRELEGQRKRLELGGALPFRFAAHFADVAAAGGFSLVIGNPPWVRPHAVPHADRVRLRREFHSMRHAAWRIGATRAGAGVGFAAQADLATAFVERSVQLLAPGGMSALLVPAKLWRALAGGGIRAWMHNQVDVRAVHDWSQSPAVFDAAVYPSLVVAERRTEPPPSRRPIRVTLAHRSEHSAFTVDPRHLSFAGDPAAPWLLLPDAVRSAFERLRLAGPALGDSSLGRPILGVKCGCNAAFLVHAIEHDDETASVVADGRCAHIERQMLRPVLRGDGVQRLTAPTPGVDGELRILWTHGIDGAPLRALPPAAARWLAHWRPRLERRRDARARHPWWTLFRTEAARHESPRVVWADIGKRLRPRVLHAGDPTVPLNTCYVMRTSSMDDAYAIESLLGSTVAAGWFETLAEPARGGFRRFMGWTVATLPVPTNWTTARYPLADLGRRRAAGESIAVDQYESAIAAAYGIPLRHLEPLMRWALP
ncbi:MAG: N-6 DNA methylase [Gemmatimonadaceae bacterium]|nr:N-6 DNA methylase [Gemmatimonadaceae bacterium]